MNCGREILGPLVQDPNLGRAQSSPAFQLGGGGGMLEKRHGKQTRHGAAKGTRRVQGGKVGLLAHSFQPSCAELPIARHNKVVSQCKGDGTGILYLQSKPGKGSGSRLIRPETKRGTRPDPDRIACLQVKNTTACFRSHRASLTEVKKVMGNAGSFDQPPFLWTEIHRRRAQFKTERVFLIKQVTDKGLG